MKIKSIKISLFGLLLIFGDFSSHAQWSGSTFTGNSINFQPTTSGGSFLVNFNSNVNSGSDKGFLLFQDDSGQTGGSSNEDLRFTIGVFNDFRQENSPHSDELWLQGGGRLVQNVGNWDAEYASLIGSVDVGLGVTGGYEWRVNNSVKMNLIHDGILRMVDDI